MSILNAKWVKLMYAITEQRWNDLHTNVHLLAILTLLNLSDFLLTTFLISVYGFEAEGNILLRSLMYKMDSAYAILFVKSAFLFILWAAIGSVKEDCTVVNQTHLGYSLKSLNIIFSLVIIWSAFLCIQAVI